MEEERGGKEKEMEKRKRETKRGWGSERRMSHSIASKVVRSAKTFFLLFNSRNYVGEAAPSMSALSKTPLYNEEMMKRRCLSSCLLTLRLKNTLHAIEKERKQIAISKIMDKYRRCTNYP